MIKNYLVGSADEPITHWKPTVVAATSEQEAIQNYMRVIYSKDEIFRETVLDLALNVGFVGRFVLSTTEEIDCFYEKNSITARISTIHERIYAFFSINPAFAERFIQYMETEDTTLISEEMYEFIAERDLDGIAALELDSIVRLVSPKAVTLA